MGRPPQSSILEKSCIGCYFTKDCGNIVVEQLGVKTCWNPKSRFNGQFVNNTVICDKRRSMEEVRHEAESN